MSIDTHSSLPLKAHSLSCTSRTFYKILIPLHLFARVVTDLCRSCDERDILNSFSELLLAFNKIISEGYQETVNLPQAKSNVKCHEEKLQEAIAKNKERAKQFDL
ncbi:hypothetical protein [Absidia glauca]|uniref:Coatomer subunit delta n=1 Tax=Absidia glauca TaxID=4829 RepID=A0A168LGE7_ABSGL|nr:hypothetical protein [Absidia glauca]